MNGGDTKKAPLIAQEHPGFDAGAVANGVGDLVLVDDPPGIEVLPASGLGALGNERGYRDQLFAAVPVFIPRVAVAEHFYWAIEHKSDSVKTVFYSVGQYERVYSSIGHCALIGDSVTLLYTVWMDPPREEELLCGEGQLADAASHERIALVIKQSSQQ